MRYTDSAIKLIIIQFIEETEESELRYVISFCIGYFGSVTADVWRVIVGLIDSGIIDN